MKRVEYKVKDIVDVRPFPYIQDLAADPAETVAGYCFTDITSDLFAKWVHLIAGLRPEQGVACALAGYRGVGKSHFFALLGSLLAHGELRDRVKDEHAASALGQLPRRHYTVIHVRRGTGSTLMEELISAVASTLKVDLEAGSSVDDVLSSANSVSGEAIILIDTALGREERVSRDDGAALTEIAARAIALGMFVGVALDDDISGADGPNSVISKAFAIDYLDQEHLYKVLERFVFPKNEAKRPALHNIYDNIRKDFPAFRWSEQRFSAIYPLHPATLEIAPVVRLYLQDFGLLRFASDAGAKVRGRPANSLVCLDEVFDSVEERIRNVPALEEAFSTYSAVERSVIEKAPVIKRLQAKLVLKVLFLLSLQGRASTADEIACTMLLAPHKGSVDDLRSLLASFADAEPRIKVSGQGTDAAYQLDIGEGAAANLALDAAAARVDDAAVWRNLLDLTVEKFSDVGANEIANDGRTRCLSAWRGALRRGEVRWLSDEKQFSSAPEVEWTVVVDPGAGDSTAHQPDGTVFVWRPDQLTQDELDTVRKHTALSQDTSLRDQLGEGSSPLLQLHALATERIWERAFLTDALFLADSCEIRMAGFESVHTLAQLFSELLAKVFEERHPDHPVFETVLGPRETAKLVANFFGYQDVMGQETQRLAEMIAIPLGLAVKEDAFIRPATAEELMTDPLVSRLFSGIDEVFEISTLASKLKDSARGLSRDAQRLVLAALVSQREFEFVTSTGSRISHRSLDLQLMWDDIVGLAKSSPHDYSKDRLVRWATLLSGQDTGSTSESDDVAGVLSNWLNDWNSRKLLERFDALADDELTVWNWKVAHRVRSSFGAAADAITRLTSGDIDVSACLTQIADAFLDSVEEHHERELDLHRLESLLSDIDTRRRIGSYLARSQVTDVPMVEQARRSLSECLLTPHVSTPELLEENWAAFHSAYVTHYAETHNAETRQKLKDLSASTGWSTYQICTSLPSFGSFVSTGRSARSRVVRPPICSSDLAVVLQDQPFCDCQAEFVTGGVENGENNFSDDYINDVVDSFRSSVQAEAECLRLAAEPLSEPVRDHLEAVLERAGSEPFYITPQEAVAIRAALEAAKAGMQALDRSDRDDATADREQPTPETVEGS